MSMTCPQLKDIQLTEEERHGDILSLCDKQKKKKKKKKKLMCDMM